jgi:hypothetical protein
VLFFIALSCLIGAVRSEQNISKCIYYQDPLSF